MNDKNSPIQSGNALPVFASAQSEAAIVTSNTATQPAFKSLWVTTSGDIAVSRDNGVTVVTYTAVPVGEFNLATPCFIMTATTAVMIGQNW